MGCTMKDKNHIIKRVQEQFFRFGIKSLSMDEIAHQLGISKKTLYEMVSNKESLVELVITAFFEEQRSAIEGICRQATSPIQELFDLTRHISGVSGRLSESMMHDLKKYFPENHHRLLVFCDGFLFDKVRSNIERGIEAGEYRASLQPEFAAKLYLASLSSIMKKEYPFGNSHDVLDLFLDMHLKGMTSTKGSKIYEKHLGRKPLPGQHLT